MKDRIIASLLLMVLCGCVTNQQSKQIQHFKGHWTVGAAYSWFAPLNSNKRFQVIPSDLPPCLVQYQTQRPQNPDSQSEFGTSSSVYLEFDGIVYDANPDYIGRMTIKITKLYYYGPAHKDYISSLNQHP